MTDGRIRLAEVLAALSIATDLGLGQPAGHAARTCLLAMRLARALGVGGAELSDVYYVSLLRYIGCTADAFEVAALAGDEIGIAAAVGPAVMGEPAEEAAAVALPGGNAAKAVVMATHCEAAELLAGRLGLGAGVLTALRHGFERWDGRGNPAGLAAEAVPLPVRVAVVARDAELWHRRAGYAATAEVLRHRRGRAYDPAVVDAILGGGEPMLAGTAVPPWEEVLAAEPAPVHIGGDRLDTLLAVAADFADLKIPYALGHSRQVARLAEAAARDAGLGDECAVRLRRAGLLHDLGRTGISNVVWDQSRPLSADEWERVRLHPYLTERILERTALLRPLARLAGAHHERLDGGGYHRGSPGSALGMAERVLAAADCYQAMLQQRPHRRARTPAEAARELAAEVADGRLDPRAAAAVTAAAGQTSVRLPSRWPGGLTDREVDVLRLACRGLSKPQVAQALCISVKTVGRHLENSYAKIGVSSRAGAALYAVHHGLLGETG
ncbi:HD domain-containing phosphohydrolase [Amycolatopsis sp. ATCC 39116]|uniref:HD domain-containing phosphohydrolase n=1 Tax=Amycolatopsis sp. (strain ATCC 39116 / 75iv2) TaxID=385957 RepID=UPI00026255BF|nr:HD domain-containing phosphohydrolase [Amycolatopsis sp. ATCC 39116]